MFLSPVHFLLLSSSAYPFSLFFCILLCSWFGFMVFHISVSCSFLATVIIRLSIFCILLYSLFYFIVFLAIYFCFPFHLSQEFWSHFLLTDVACLVAHTARQLMARPVGGAVTLTLRVWSLGPELVPGLPPACQLAQEPPGKSCNTVGINFKIQYRVKEIYLLCHVAMMHPLN